MHDATREKGILELVYSDVFGPVPVLSLGKSVLVCFIYRWLLKEHMDLFPLKEIWSICQV